MATRNWNPSEPYALGLEWPGMRSLALPLTQEVEYGHTFQADATETIDTAAFEIMQPSVAYDARNTALITVYRRDSNDIDETGDEMEYGVVNATIVACNGGAVAAPTALVGAGTVAACLVTPSDNNYVHAISGGTVDIEFATAGLFTGKRILEVKLLIAMSELTDAGENTAPNALIQLRRGATLVDQGFGTADPFTGPFQVQKLSFGEVFFDTTTVPKCWPWTVANVADFDAAGTTVVRVELNSLPEFAIEYAALEVVWCEENRTAVGAVLMGVSTGAEAMAPGRHVVNLRTPAGADNWAKVGDDYYTVTVTGARSSDLFLRITKGDAPLVPLVDSFTVFANHQGRVAPRLRSNVLASAAYDSRVAPIKFVTTGAAVASDFAPYDRTIAAQVFNGTYAAQDIEQRSGGGTVTYPWLRFYARIIGDPTDVPAIDITTPDGTTSYTSGDLALLDEIFDGWHEVTLAWPAGQEPTIINDSSNFNVQFSTTQGNNMNRWEILGLDSFFLLLDAPASGDPTYGQGDTQAAYAPDGIGAEAGNAYADLAVTLHTAAPAVVGFDSSLVSIDLNANLFEGVAVCEATAFVSPHLTYTASTLATADFAYYEIQRQDTLDPTWRTIAKLTTKATAAFGDAEARVGIASSYRMRIVRADRIEGAWSATEVQTVPTVPNPCGTLYFSSNRNVLVGHYLAYTEVFDGSPVEEYGFVESASVVQQRVYGRYGTQSFHPTERGGVRFERDIVVNALAVPDAYADREFQLLRDLAWADIPYVCVKDDLGNRWFATLIVPSGTMQRAPQLFIANIQVIESTDVPYPVAAQA